MSKLLKRSVFYETDFTRFDQCFSAETMLSVEYQWFQRTFPFNEHPLANLLMLMALTTRGQSDIGVKYKVLGTRCSGDAHTSIFNGLTNDFMMWIMFGRCVRYHEGDDGVVAFTRKTDPGRNSFFFLEILGFQLKCDRYTSINDVSFCGMKIYQNSHHLSMYSDFWRTACKIHTICSDGKPHELARAKAFSLLALNPSTPILSAWAHLILRCTDRHKSRDKLVCERVWKTAHSLRDVYHRPSTELLKGFRNVVDFSSDELASFCHTTGMTAAQVISYHNYLNSLDYIPSSFDKLRIDVIADSATTQLYGPVVAALQH